MQQLSRYAKISATLSTLIFFLIFGYFYKDNIFSSRFVDEEDNFAIGKYLLKGDVLYDDIITNHQPVTYILSSLVQQFSKPNSTYLLVRDHRIAILLWSLLWSLIFISYFGLATLIFVFIYELTKNFLFGNLFLAEATVVYPLLFLTGLILNKKNRLNRFDLVLAGIALGFCGLSFGPIIPLLGFQFFLLIYKQKQLVKTLFYILIGILIIVLPILKYISIIGYLNYYLYSNLFYTVPSYHQSYYNEPWTFTISKSFITPLLAFLRTDITPTLSIIRILSVLLLVNIIFLISRKKFMTVLIILILLGMGNIRFVYPGDERYAAGFLPWYSSLIFIAIMTATNYLRENGNFKLKAINIILIFLTIALSLKYEQSIFSSTRDIQNDYLINFSTYTNRGDAVRVMSDTGDTLFVSPDAWLVYWQSDTYHLPKLYGYYTWISGIPIIHQSILNAFSKNPPTFFYCENCKGLDLEKFLNNYRELKNNDRPSMLYVLEEKISRLNKSQIDQLKFYGFSFN